MNKGYTLIELVTTLAVIAILLTITLPSFRGMRMEGWYIEAEAELESLKTAVESYYRYNGQYPTDIKGSLINTRPRVINYVLDDPFETDTTDTPTYGYETSNDATFGDYFIIYSWGPNKVRNNTWSADQDKVVSINDDIVVSNADVD
ncbi:MAG: type II secretion system protein [Candidatus Hydrogenedentota bacterium]